VAVPVPVLYVGAKRPQSFVFTATELGRMSINLQLLLSFHALCTSPSAHLTTYCFYRFFVRFFLEEASVSCATAASFSQTVSELALNSGRTRRSNHNVEFKNFGLVFSKWFSRRTDIYSLLDLLACLSYTGSISHEDNVVP
jgi:hypothetical protein